MNQNVKLEKNTVVLFIVNIVILVSMLLFRTFYVSRDYSKILVNVFFIINIIILITGIIFNVLLLLKKIDLKEDLVLKGIISFGVIYLLINTLVITLINKPLEKGYSKINMELANYCEKYGCDKYETKAFNGYEEFTLDKMYFDYDNMENDLSIKVKYDSKKIISITATIYSRSELFSETLVNDKVKDYFYHFGYDSKEEKIREAFDNRFKGEVKDENAIYKVEEVYKDDVLDKIKTIITLELKQD